MLLTVKLQIQYALFLTIKLPGKSEIRIIHRSSYFL